MSVVSVFLCPAVLKGATDARNAKHAAVWVNGALYHTDAAGLRSICRYCDEPISRTSYKSAQWRLVTPPEPCDDDCGFHGRTCGKCTPVPATPAPTRPEMPPGVAAVEQLHRDLAAWKSPAVAPVPEDREEATAKLQGTLDGAESDATELRRLATAVINARNRAANQRLLLDASLEVWEAMDRLEEYLAPEGDEHCRASVAAHGHTEGPNGR